MEVSVKSKWLNFNFFQDGPEKKTVGYNVLSVDEWRNRRALKVVLFVFLKL